MTAATYSAARQYACPFGHVTGVVVPVGAGIDDRGCPVCGEPMITRGAPLTGSWKVEECCTPGGPDGKWYGPRKDASRCRKCCGTRRRAVCTVCRATNCDGVHDDCLNCDGTGRVDCGACDGEGRLFDENDEVAGPCPDSGCEDGRTACPECRGSGKPAGAA